MEGPPRDARGADLGGGVTERRTATAVALVGASVFVVLAVLFVPWDPVPGGALSAPDPARFFTAAEIARGEDFARWARRTTAREPTRRARNGRGR